MSEKVVLRPWPRLMKETTAGGYLDRSPSWLRNMRYEDNERIAREEPPRGPKYIKQGRSVRYPKEFLDDWINKFVQGSPTGFAPSVGNTAGLKYQKVAPDE